MKDTVLYTKDVAMNKADMTPALMGPILIHGPLQVWSCFQGEKKKQAPSEFIIGSLSLA